MTAPLEVREPVLIRTAAVAVLTVLLHMLVVQGWLPLEAESEAFVAGLVDLLGFAAAALWSRQAVTPVRAPNTEALLESAMSLKARAEDAAVLNDGLGSSRMP